MMESDHHQRSQSPLYYHYTNPVNMRIKDWAGFMFHNHAYLLLHVRLGVLKGGGFYAFATNLTSLAYPVGRLDLTRFNSLAGDKGVEPLQTGSQSPARYHYANPQYKTRHIFLLNYPLFDTPKAR